MYAPFTMIVHFSGNPLGSTLPKSTALLSSLFTSRRLYINKISKNGMKILCPKRDLNLGLSRIAVFEDCKLTALTTQPPRLVSITCYQTGESVWQSYAIWIFDHSMIRQLSTTSIPDYFDIQISNIFISSYAYFSLSDILGFVIEREIRERLIAHICWCLGNLKKTYIGRQTSPADVWMALQTSAPSNIGHSYSHIWYYVARSFDVRSKYIRPRPTLACFWLSLN